MLSKHNLTLDSISLETSSTDAIETMRFEFTGSMRKWRDRLMSTIVLSVDCEAIFHFNNKVITATTIYGLDQNVQTAI